MADFNEWDFDDAQAAINEAVQVQLGSAEAFDENYAFVEEHDHWQDGDAWVGPDGGSSTEVRTAVLAGVERQFTPRDAINEVLDRQANALLRQEPDVDFVRLQELPDTASDEEKKAVEEEVAKLRAAISTWWDRKKLWKLARKVVKRSRWAARGSLRAWIAPGHLVVGEGSPDDDGEEETGQSVEVSLLPSVDEFADALDMVQLSAPEPDTCYVYTDEETQDRVAIFLFDDPETEKQAAELWWVDDDGKTVVKVVGAGQKEETDRAGVDLGGRLPVVEMEGELLITEPIRRQQKRLNFHESVGVRVGEAAGFPERYTLNAEPGGLWSKSPPANGPALKTQVDKGTTWYLHPAPRTLGAAITTDLVGVVMKTGDGESRATPGVVFKEPTDPDFSIKAARHAYRTILEECKQGHIFDEGTGEASGIAYEQARADYEDDLNTSRSGLEALLRETIEVAIAWADRMMATPKGYLDKYRVSVTLKVKSGPVTAAEQQQNNENVKAGTMAVETAIARNGAEDVTAELEKLRTSPESIVDLRTKQVTAIVELAAEGVPLHRAAKILGITDPEVLKEFEEAEKEREEASAQGKAQQDEVAALLEGTQVPPAQAQAQAQAQAEA